MVQQWAVLGDARILFGGGRLRGELQQVPVAAELCKRRRRCRCGEQMKKSHGHAINDQRFQR
jgi:hypothetical protein